ncbi:putative EF-hand domain pair protein [Lupinus albus]|uniref:Putative EF-hand domain pair protein n=1 Tax=Lupinus albus TaxID=3870 RepID=A0A6A4N0W0_LUPAL|nr:putative EF-hand domain pair protein [Lupinus albus]
MKDRSGKIDPLELRDALYGIGYAIPGSVLQLLLSKYGDGSGRRVELGFDNLLRVRHFYLNLSCVSYLFENIKHSFL